VQERQQIINRLHRIEGQVRGVRKMVEEEQSCAELMMQIAAVKAAVSKVGILMFQTHFRQCLEQSAKEGGSEEFIEEVMELMGKYIS